MENLIPIPQIVNYGAKPLDFSGLYNVISEIKQKNAQKKRLQQQQQFEIVKDIDVSSQWYKTHQEEAAKKIEEYQDYVTNLYTFKQDETGGFTKKLKRNIFNREPSLSDKEHIDVLNKATQLVKEFASYKESDESMAKDAQLYKNSPDKFDSEKWAMKESDYYVTGIYKGDGLTDAPSNIYEEINKNDIRTPEQKKESKTLEGNKIIYTTQSADPEVRDATWNTMMLNPGNQKSVVQLMLAREGVNAKNYIVYDMLGEGFFKDAQGNDIDPQNLSQEKKYMLAQTYKKVTGENGVLDKYETSRDYDQNLVRAGINYSKKVLKLNEKIGQGYRREEQSEALYNDAIRRARTEADKKKDETPIQEVKRTFAGKTYNNYVDLSTMPPETITVTNYKLPDNAVKYVEKIDLKTGQKKSIWKGNESVTIKNPIEGKTAGTYMVAGYDRQKGIIRLVKKDQESLIKRGYAKPGEKGKPIEMDEESYIIPIQKNEYLIDESYKKMEGNKATTIPDNNLPEFEWPTK